MLLEQITEDIKTAMKSKEPAKVLVLRTLKGEIQREASTPDDAKIVALIKKTVNTIKETTNDVEEIGILEVYLPTQLSSVDLGGLAYEYITENKLEGVAGLGKTMGHFKATYGGQYDGGELSKIVKGHLGV